MQNKSGHCLRNAYNVFCEGDVESALRRLNITFNHTTNDDWSPADIQQILTFSSWLYFYECRFEKVATVLERAIKHCSRGSNEQRQFLPHLYYNLAECYNRLNDEARCESNFKAALELLDGMPGSSGKSFKLIKQRQNYLRRARRVEQLFTRTSSATLRRVESADVEQSGAQVHSLANRRLQLVRM